MINLPYYFIKYCYYYIFGRFYHLGWRVGFSHGVMIKNANYISLGSRVYLGNSVTLQAPDEHLDAGTNKPKLVIQSNITINVGTIVSVASRIIIEDDVLIGPYCYISDYIHAYQDVTRSIRHQGIAKISPVHIGKGAWLGAHVVVCPGVTIGQNCVIGANSVVNSDIPAFSVAVGSPAKVVKQYNFNSQEWIKV